MEARIAIAESLAQELDMDMSPGLLDAVDQFLAQLWMRGYKVVVVTGDEAGETPTGGTLA